MLVLQVMYNHSMYSMFYFFFKRQSLETLALILFQKWDFSNGFCNDQRDAVVVILRYTMLPHNDL